MLIKFFSRGTGSGAGPINYLLSPRPEPPEVLRGDPAQTRDLIDSIDRKHRYTSGVLSFAVEDAPTEDQQQTVMDEFEAVAFAGLERDQFDCLWVRHSEHGRVELHFVTPKTELTSGRQLNVAPPGWQGTYGALETALNAEYGWARPDDPERAREHRPLYEPQERAQTREAIQELVTGWVAMQAVTDRESLVQQLESTGLEVTRRVKGSITVKDPQSDEKWRLTGRVYERDWTYDAELDRAAEIAPARRSERDNGVHAAPALDLSAVAREARERLSVIVAARTERHRERYARPAVEPVREPGQGRAPAEPSVDHDGSRLHRSRPVEWRHDLGVVEQRQIGSGAPDPRPGLSGGAGGAAAQRDDEAARRRRDRDRAARRRAELSDVAERDADRARLDSWRQIRSEDHEVENDQHGQPDSLRTRIAASLRQALERAGAGARRVADALRDAGKTAADFARAAQDFERSSRHFDQAAQQAGPVIEQKIQKQQQQRYELRPGGPSM